jgi:hypothetical protein
VIIAMTLVGVTALAATACGRPAAARTPSMPAATTTAGRPATATSAAVIPAVAEPAVPDPRVGAIFVGDSPTPTCSGSVLHSAAGDLILTAAHCLAEGVDTSFVPGYAGAPQPDSTWAIDAVYIDPRWLDTQDPLTDYAIARVTRDADESIESRVGGGLMLAAPPTAPRIVTVIGYRIGSADVPIHCQAGTAPVAGGYLSLPCAGLVAGTSGAPWMTGTSMVTGLTGGLDGGGCEDDVSYSPPFDEGITRLLTRAEQGGTADAAPTATGGCPAPP